MHKQLQAFLAEVHKNKHAKAIWISFIAFSLAPLFGGLFMLLMKDSGYDGLSGALRSKAIMMSFQADWNSFLGFLSQAVGVGGIMIFGFVASWLFGREYADNTAKDLLSLPVSRAKILNAKFIYYLLWCFALVLLILIEGLCIGFLLQLPGWHIALFLTHFEIYLITTTLILLLNTPIAFFAISGKGYLAPLGVVALLLVFAQIFAAMGFGSHFPWSVPGIYSGSGGEEMRFQLDLLSYLLVVITGITGYVSTLLWWKYADQSK